jgi:hypothetical protein
VSDPGSVTLWISHLKAGDPPAAQPLRQNYFRQLVARTRQRLAGTPLPAAGEEDIAARLGRVPWTVKRRLQLIRKIREQELPA